jgi:predicted transglutaminase-like protease
MLVIFENCEGKVIPWYLWCTATHHKTLLHSRIISVCVCEKPLSQQYCNVCSSIQHCIHVWARTIPDRTLTAMSVQTILVIYMQVWICGLATFCQSATFQCSFCKHTLKHNDVLILFHGVPVSISANRLPWKHIIVLPSCHQDIIAITFG